MDIDTKHTYFISDTHFNHKAIIKYCNRPFKDINQMNETIITNWNNTVKKDDLVFMMGDFALCGKDKIIEIGNQLNGRKFLIKGNHDGASRDTYRKAGFLEVYEFPIIINDFYIVSHMPQFVSEAAPYFNIHGHIHDNPMYADVSSRSFCASVERTNYTPISFNKILNRVEEHNKAEEDKKLILNF